MSSRKLPSDGFAKVAVSGTAWIVSQSILNKIATLLSIYIISLRLSPAEFGVAILTLSIVKFSVILPPLTMSDVLIAKQDNYKSNFSNLANLIFRIGLINSILIIVTAPLIAFFYSNYTFSILVGLIMVAGLRPTGEALAVLPLTNLRQHLLFKKIALIDGLVQFGATLITIILAFINAGALALVLPQVIAVFVKSYLYKKSQFIEDPVSTETAIVYNSKLKKTLLGNFINVSSAQYIHSILDTIPILILGFVTNESQTGLYGFALQLASQVNAIISFQLGGVLQPIFAKLNSDPLRQLNAFIRSLRLISSIVIPLAFMQAALSTPIFSLFKSEWLPAANIFALLSIVEAFYFSTAPTMAFLKSQSRFKLYFSWQIIQLIFSLFIYIYSAYFGGAIGLSWAAVLVWGASLPLIVWISTRGAGATFMTILKIFLIPIALSLPLALAAFYFSHLLNAFGLLGTLLSLFIVGPILLLLSIWLNKFFNPQIYIEIKTYISPLLNKIKITKSV